MLRSARLALLFAAVCLVGGGFRVAWAQKQELGVESLIYVGTRTGGDSEAKGIYLFKMRTSDDPNIPEFVTVTPLGLVAETESPVFLELDGKRRLLFCVRDVASFGGKKTGAVSAYAIDPSSGHLTLINERSSMGRGACHLALDHTGRHLLVANETTGNVAVLPVAADGTLGEATHVQQHQGQGADPQKQPGPRPHGVAFSPDNQFAFVCDAGLDKVFIYAFDAETGKLKPADPAFFAAKAGAGPRHLVFRTDGKFAYVVNELDSTVTALKYDPKTGGLTELQTLSALPGYYDGPNAAAEIGMHVSGKNLLVSNCGHHSVVLFEIDSSEGTLTYIEDQSTYGTMPRHFGMEQAGKHVVVANEESGSILILRSPENSRVKPAGNITKTPTPTCAKFLPK